MSIDPRPANKAPPIADVVGIDVRDDEQIDPGVELGQSSAMRRVPPVRPPSTRIRVGES